MAASSRKRDGSPNGANALYFYWRAECRNGTVEKVMSAAQADLEAIAWIGPKTASAIRSVLS